MKVARVNGPPPIEVRALRKVFWQTASGQAVVAIDRLDLKIAVGFLDAILMGIDRVEHFLGGDAIDDSNHPSRKAPAA